MLRRKSSLGLDENLVSLLCYLFWWITGLIFLILERKSRVVKFHAIQSIFTFLVLTLIGYGIRTVSNIPLIGGLFAWLLSSILGLLWLVLWILLMFKAFIGEMFKLPFIGDIAERYCG